MDLRCDFKKHGELHEDTVEVKCSSRYCGARAGVVVLHRFSIDNGKLMDTLRFRDPMYKEARRNGADNHPAAIRT